MTPLAALDRKIAALPADVFQVFTSSKSPATEKELAALEKKVAVRFPEPLRELLLRYGALVIEVKADVWPRPQALDVAPAWQFQYGVQVLGVGETVPPDLRIEEALSPALKESFAVPY
ncbi:MAG TPA: SMI1/KNR4 family protein, partial [Labilithrix sp.]|nr:SMI1/KNR4 family protein [Labilithrix sp.]